MTNYLYPLFSFAFIFPYNHHRLNHHHPLFLVFLMRPFVTLFAASISSFDIAAFAIDTVNIQWIHHADVHPFGSFMLLLILFNQDANLSICSQWHPFHFQVNLTIHLFLLDFKVFVFRFLLRANLIHLPVAKRFAFAFSKYTPCPQPSILHRDFFNLSSPPNSFLLLASFTR